MSEETCSEPPRDNSFEFNLHLLLRHSEASAIGIVIQVEQTAAFVVRLLKNSIIFPSTNILYSHWSRQLDPELCLQFDGQLCLRRASLASK